MWENFYMLSAPTLCRKSIAPSPLQLWSDFPWAQTADQGQGHDENWALGWLTLAFPNSSRLCVMLFLSVKLFYWLWKWSTDPKFPVGEKNKVTRCTLSKDRVKFFYFFTQNTFQPFYSLLVGTKKKNGFGLHLKHVFYRNTLKTIKFFKYICT